MKKLFGIMAIVAIMATIGLNFKQNKNEIVMSDLALANVEALARGEGPGPDWDKHELKYPESNPRGCCKAYAAPEKSCSGYYPECP